MKSYRILVQIKNHTDPNEWLEYSTEKDLPLVEILVSNLKTNPVIIGIMVDILEIRKVDVKEVWQRSTVSGIISKIQ